MSNSIDSKYFFSETYDNEEQIYKKLLSYNNFSVNSLDRVEKYNKIILTGFSSKYLNLITNLLAFRREKSINLFHFEDSNNYEKSRGFIEKIASSERIFFEKGVKHNITKLTEVLSRIGYIAVRRVENEGDFSVLGDVVLIYPYHQKEIVRISFFDNEVEEISIVDVINRQTIQKIDNYTVSGIIVDSKDISSHKTEKSSENINPQKQFLYKKSSYKNSQISDEDSAVYISFEKYVNTDYDSLANESVQKLYKELKYLKLNINIQDIIGFDLIASSKTALNKIIKIYEKDGYELLFISSELMNKLNLKNGFSLPDLKIVFFTEYELSGQLDITEYSNDAHIMGRKVIKLGDLVVHTDHGIGIYDGIITKKVDGISKTYINLKYANNDRLFVPIDQSSKINLYIGAKKELKGLSRRGKLTALNSGGWRRTKSIAEIEAKRIATELIQIESLRRLSKVEKIIKSARDKENIWNFVKTFSFKDTDDQFASTEEIIDDLSKDIPMDRLLVGDVGFGKTEIALRGAYAVIQAGYQVAFLAPTTILVSQHKAVIEKRFQNVKRMIEKEFGNTPLNEKNRKICVESLSRLNNRRERNLICDKLAEGQIDILVGTHAILSDAVKFKKLGLVIIDEEQKFGVKQKEKLKHKRLDTHILSLSATPIPRTLNISLSGIRDISILTTPIPNRKAIRNIIANFNWDIVFSAIKKELDRKGQVYFLHNRVRDLNEKALQILEQFPDKNVATIHGRMSSNDLAKIMGDFAKGLIDVLVCTTIIENGIDLPNVNTLIIETPERLGLSQMYQIRGRIGRSDRQAYTYILYKKLGGNTALRVETLEQYQGLGSGFMLANRDMEIRGAGNLLGREQSGMMNSVGYNLFMKMVEEAVKDINGRNK